jgi:hypothetical protein
LLFVVFLLALQLLLGVTTALAEPGYHMVRPGETLFSIGRLYGVNPYSIASANGLYNPNYIQIGQVLYVPTYGGWSYPSWTPHYPSQYWWPSWGYGYGHGYGWGGGWGGGWHGGWGGGWGGWGGGWGDGMVR